MLPLAEQLTLGSLRDHFPDQKIPWVGQCRFSRFSGLPIAIIDLSEKGCTHLDHEGDIIYTDYRALMASTCTLDEYLAGRDRHIWFRTNEIFFVTSDHRGGTISRVRLSATNHAKHRIPTLSFQILHKPAKTWKQYRTMKADKFLLAISSGLVAWTGRGKMLKPDLQLNDGYLRQDVIKKRGLLT